MSRASTDSICCHRGLSPSMNLTNNDRNISHSVTYSGCSVARLQPVVLGTLTKGPYQICKEIQNQNDHNSNKTNKQGKVVPVWWTDGAPEGDILD